MKTTLLLLSILLPIAPGIAQDKTPYVVPRYVGSFTLDGIPDEPGWQTIAPLGALMHIPTLGAQPSERTEAKLAYDDNFLYVAAWLYDSDPNGVRGTTFQRDTPGNGGDWFSFNLDTFADKENSLNFATTPTGNRIDFTVRNDAQVPNNDWVNFSWNTFWYCATSRNREGWYTEFQIPLSSLRYQDQNGRVVMGMSFNRRIARKNELDSYPLISTQWGGPSIWKSSQMQPIVFESLHPRKPVYITPYVLGGHSLSHQLNENQSSYQAVNKPTFNAGLDMKVGLTSNLTADLTINTDFAQVEADDQQVNLTRFSLFFPEKRLFFQERSSIFNFGFGAPNQLFYSRQIGLNNGQAVPILAGVRVVGRVGRWDVGLMDMQTGAKFNLPSENMGVLRFRRQVFNPNSYVGLMTTSRIGADGRSNLAYGLDGIFRLFAQDFLAINWAQTFDWGPTQPNYTRSPASLDPARIRVQWENRNRKGFGYDLSYSRAGIDYNPTLGFEFRKNYTRFGDRIFWGWLPGKDSRIINHQLGVNGYAFIRNTDGTTESVELAPTWNAELKSGYVLQARLRHSVESIRDSLQLFGDVYVPAGHYRFNGLLASVETPGANQFNAVILLDGGQFYDGQRWSVSVTPTWAISRFVELGGFVQWNRVTLPTLRQPSDIALVRLKTRLALNIKLMLDAFIQYNSAANVLSSNIRFRYNPREGNDLFIVFNQGNNTNRLRAEPVIPFINDRTIVVKYTYTFVR
ncbi:hypothetical protein GCM10023189_51360 [Nibrella saemangeumensis]|uniref:DUF5916 domain-containing protein n=1 Tax=Nibrella saemangeumensis TaxID=1084526 RepID=A0ABP8NIB8_9BACT